MTSDLYWFWHYNKSSSYIPRRRKLTSLLFICSKQATEFDKEHAGSFYYINTPHSKETFIATYIVRKNTYHTTQIFNGSSIHQKTSLTSPFKDILLRSAYQISSHEVDDNIIKTLYIDDGTENTSFKQYDNFTTSQTIKKRFRCRLYKKTHFQHRNLHQNLNITSKHIKSSHLQIRETHSTIIYRFFKSNSYICLDIAR